MTNNSSFTHDISRRKAYQHLNPQLIATEHYKNSAYPHLTFQVNNVTEYLEVIDSISKAKWDDFVNGEIIYRGMANKDWKLIPSLARCDDLSLCQERNLINGFLSLRPDAFQNLSTHFELLSKMQHYGLPTRLLDFTANPLIALFFACSELENKTDARIVCHRAYVELAKDPMIESVCGFYTYPSIEDLHLDDIGVQPQLYLHRLYRQRGERLLIARPYYWNERIQRQAAVFMVFPNRLSDDYARWAYGGRQNYSIWEEEEYTAKLEQIAATEPLERIYPKAKERDFEVTHQSVINLWDHYCSSSAVNSLSEWSPVFQGRFSFSPEIQEIDIETIKKEFCSIIIGKKAKKTILKQLAMLGIDEAYVYPELQYTAKKLKQLYFDNQ